jgi:predicted O-methyltransferase YrrM
VLTEKPTPVARRIEAIIAVVPGWTPPDQLLALHLLVLSTAHLAGDILEIGSWCGRSTVVLAEAARLSGRGRVHAVDLFPHRDDWKPNADGSHSFTVDIDDYKVGGYQDQTVWDEPFQRDIATVYEKFESILEAFNHTMTTQGVVDRVTPFRGNGAMFLAQADTNLRCRLAFLDGDHSYDAVCADIDVAETLLLPGGWIAFDDAFSHYDGVDRAIRDRIIASKAYDCAHLVTRKLFVARRIAG